MKFQGTIYLLGLGLTTTLAMPLDAVSNSVANGQIISLAGQVHLKRESRETFNATIGTFLYPGDELISLNNSKVVVQCADLTLQSIQTSQANNCGEVAAEDKCTSGLKRCPRRGDKVVPWEQQPTPYLISPRYTKLLNAQPSLRWQEVPGANSYTVTVEEGGQVVWQTEVSQTQVVYAGEQSLQSGKEYLITVIADTGEFYLSPLIKLLDEAEVQQLRAAEAEIQQGSLDDVGKGIAIANVYLEYGLQSEALLLLEESVINKVQTAALYQQLGDLYFLEQLLVPQAEVYYKQALELVNADNLEAKAAIQDSLGQVYISLDDSEKAHQNLTAAKEGYEVLGDLEKVASLKVQLQQLDEEFR